MKRYDDVTILKGFACLTVFTTHWLGSFGSFGSGRFDWLMQQGPLMIITRGSYVVPVFLMLTGLLVCQKVMDGRFHSWSEEIVKRYLRLVIPVAATSVLALLMFRAGLFYNRQAASLMGNEWLAMYYGDLPGWRFLPGKALFGTVILGDDTYYGPFWMLNYTFLGSIFVLVFASALKEMRGNGRIAAFAVLAVLFVFIDTHYFSLYLGCLLAVFFRKIDAWRESAGKNNVRVTAAVLGFIFLAGSAFIGMRSFYWAAWMAERGVGGATGNPFFYGAPSVFLLIAGVRFLWIAGLSRIPVWCRTPLIWLGERSMGVYLTHWLFICSFSSWFYTWSFGRGNRIAIGVNIIITLVLVFIAAEIYCRIVEEKAYTAVWGKIRKWIWQ